MRKLSLLLLACLTLGIAWAERVSVNTAQQVAANVAAGLSPSNLRSSSDLKLVYAAPAKQQSGLRAAGNESDYYIFNVGTGDGFIIVAGEDRVRPVLGYSAEGEVDIEKMPGNMKAWLEMYQEEISWAVAQNISASGEIQGEWQGLLNGSTQLRAGEPQLQTAHWAQGEPFNRLTPEIEGEQAVTGCVATAQAIVMYYYKYPNAPLVSSSENTATVAIYDAVKTSPNSNWYERVLRSETPWSAPLSDRYDWDDMLFEYDNNVEYGQEGDAVAKLMKDCGVNVAMEYSVLIYPNGDKSYSSGASTNLVAASLKNVFGYSQSVQYVSKAAYRWADWIALIKNEIDEKRPVILNGTNEQKEGHAFVCDGYNSENYFHINWGWGNSFGDYLLSALDEDGTGSGFATENYGAVIGIQPEGGEPADIPLFISDMQYGGDTPLPNRVTLTAYYEYVASEDIPFWIGMAVVDDAGNIIQEPTSHSEFSNWTYIGNIYSGYRTYTITLSSPLTEGQRIAAVHSLDEGETWKVTRIGAEAPLGLNNDGLIEQEPDDPNVPVEPENITATVVYNSFNDRYSYPVINQETGGRIDIQTNQEADLIFRYTLEDYENWIGKLSIKYEAVLDREPIYDFDFSQNGIVDIPSEYCAVKVNNEDGSAVYTTIFDPIIAQQAGALNFKIEVLDKTGETCYATFENIGTRFVKAPVEMVFNPDAQQIVGNTNTDISFTLTLKNLDDFFVGKDISLDFLTGKYNLDDFTLTYYPTEGEPQSVPWEYNSVGSLVGSLTIHNAQNDVPYSFTLNSKIEMNPEVGQFTDYISFWLSYEDIDILLTQDYGIRPSITAMNIVEVYGEEDYITEHEGATVIVHPSGIYKVNVAGATINSLTVEDGGQVIIQQPLTVNEKARVILDIPTDKWRTVAIPFDALVLADGTDMCFKQGYRFVDEQRWIDEEYQTNGQYALTTSPYIAAAEFDMTHVVFEQMGDYVYTLPIPEYTAVFGNKENGDWFHFVANPNWQNLLVNGKAYVLNEAGNSFELQQSPVIPPFQAYMIASESVMKQVSSLRIGDIPTSNEDLAVTGFRVWTESGHVCFETTEAKDVAVYSMNGVQQCRFERSVGVQRQQLPQGIYIVVCDGTAYKVSVK